MGYRPSSAAPKGRWGIALDRLRKERDLSVSRAFELWHEGLGLSPRSRAAYIALEHGKEPSAAQERYLRQTLRIEPSEAVLEAQPTPAEVVAAIDRLTAAVEAQTRTQEGIAQGFAEVLAEIAARLAAAPSQTPNGSVGQ